MNADELRLEILELLPRLRRYTYSLTGDFHDANDLLQATVERLLSTKAPEKFQVDKWTFRICRNLWIDELRSRKVRAATSMTDNAEIGEPVDGERQLMSQLAYAEIRAALDRLPADQRATLMLVVVEGYTYAEATDILGAPIGTIMSRVARARSALAGALRSEPKWPQLKLHKGMRS